jgi:hypothetical protein
MSSQVRASWRAELFCPLILACRHGLSLPPAPAGARPTPSPCTCTCCPAASITSGLVCLYALLLLYMACWTKMEAFFSATPWLRCVRVCIQAASPPSLLQRWPQACKHKTGSDVHPCSPITQVSSVPLLPCRHNGRVQMTEGGRKYATRCPFTGGRLGGEFWGWGKFADAACGRVLRTLPAAPGSACAPAQRLGGPLLQATSPPCAAPAARHVCTTALSTRPTAWSREQCCAIPPPSACLPACLPACMPACLPLPARLPLPDCNESA